MVVVGHGDGWDFFDQIPLFVLLRIGQLLTERIVIIGGRLTEPWSILTETRLEQLTEWLKNDWKITSNMQIV